MRISYLRFVRPIHLKFLVSVPGSRYFSLCFPWCCGQTSYHFLNGCDGQTGGKCEGWHGIVIILWIACPPPPLIWDVRGSRLSETVVARLVMKFSAAKFREIFVQLDLAKFETKFVNFRILRNSQNVFRYHPRIHSGKYATFNIKMRSRLLAASGEG
jgi:hypothetical protein